MKRVLIVFATGWDARQLEACRPSWEDRFALEWAEPSDAECPWNLDVGDWVERTARRWRGRVDGVFSSSDYPGATLCAALARELGLPGPDPAAVIRSSHKYVSRLIQRAAVPEAVPSFDLVDPGHPERAPATGFPCFVSRSRAPSRCSRVAWRARTSCERSSDGRQWASSSPSGCRSSTSACGATPTSRPTATTSSPLGLLRGTQLTVEGFSVDGEVEILGVVDSMMYPGTSSFARFDYPSSLDEPLRERMRVIARRTVLALGLDRSMFNVELTLDPEQDRVSILEVNPRLCGQFGDLYELVHGVNGYTVALELATGGRPRIERGAGPFNASASFPLRIFEPSRVVHAPDDEALRAVEQAFPGTHVWSECRTGDAFTDFERAEDGSSARYAIVNTGAESHAALLERAEAIRAALDFRFEPLG